MQTVRPRKMTEAIVRWTKGDQVLLAADPAARAAYIARVEGAAPPAPSDAPAEPERSAA